MKDLKFVSTIRMKSGCTVIIDGVKFYPSRDIAIGEEVVLTPRQGQKNLYLVEKEISVNSGGTLVATGVFTFTRVLTATDLGV